MAEYGLGEFTRNNNTYKYVAEIDVDSALSPTSENPVQNKVVKEALDTKANQATTYTKTETDNAIAAAAFIPTSAKGTANGVAELDNNGKIPSAQLPSYVDDVVEGYYDSTTDRFYEESSFTTVIPPEANKSWVDITSNKSYRWSGSVYVRVDEGVQLGTTHGSAAYGDEGLAAYQHSQINSGNPHGTNLDDLSNVSIDNNITNGQILKYENGEWINGTGGSSSLSDLSDTSIVNPNDGQILKYNGTNWVNSNESGGGTTVIPNPQGTPTDELNSIQINNDIYEIVGGSGGGSSILTGYTMPTSNIGNNGDVYILFDALDPSYINPNFSNFGLNLTNWTYDYSDHFEIIYKMNSRQSGNWAPFIGTSGANDAGLYMQYNGWGNLSLINMRYNGVYSGDQTIPIDSIYDYVNYYKFVGSANNFTFYKGPALDNIATVAAQYTFSAATGSSNETVKLFKSIGSSSAVSTFDMNIYGIKVYNSNNELIHDYIPIADGLHDKVDNTDYVTSTSGHISHIGVPSNVLGIYYKNEGTWILISNDGTSVIANPTGTPTDELDSVQIGNTIYEIAGGGTADYEDLNNKPTINGVTLDGDITLADLGLKETITLSQAEFDALDPEEQANPDIIYYINDANSGNGLEQTLLWDYVADNNNSVLFGTFNVTLHDNINNYDLLLVEIASSSGDLSSAVWNSTNQFIVSVDALNNSYNNNYFNYTSFNERSSRYYVKDTTFQKIVDNQGNTNGLVKVYGLKFSGGSGKSNTNKYSTNEQVIGEWINGKPIYRKVLNNGGNPLPLNNDVSDLNIETLIYTDAIGSDNSNYSYPKWTINSVSSNSNRIIYMSDANTIKREGQFNVYSIILEYTKTTD